MNSMTLANILEDYNVEFSKVQAFFLRNDLGKIVSPDVILSEEQYNAFCWRFKTKKKYVNPEEIVKNKRNKKKKNQIVKTKLTNDKDVLIKAFIGGQDKDVLSYYAPFNTCLGVLSGLYKYKENRVGIYPDLSQIFNYPHTFKYSELFSKRLTINNTTHYYFYDKGGKKDIIIYKCLGTLIICLLSEAVNKKKITMAQYHILMKKYIKRKGPLSAPPEKPKKKPKQWYSVVSVPMGGMNKRR